MLVGFLTDANVDANAWIRETCQALASQNLHCRQLQYSGDVLSACKQVAKQARD